MNDARTPVLANTAFSFSAEVLKAWPEGMRREGQPQRTETRVTSAWEAGTANTFKNVCDPREGLMATNALSAGINNTGTDCMTITMITSYIFCSKYPSEFRDRSVLNLTRYLTLN